MGSDPIYAIDLDVIDHRCVIATDRGERVSLELAGRSVASFHRELVAALASVGVDPSPILHGAPFDLPDAHRPFAEDDEHATYEQDAVTAYWRTLARVNLLLERFSGRFSGKTSPVHHFWHTFDIAATRFSDKPVPHDSGTDGVTREAYSREVISFGFWFGDPRVPEPTFYSYTSPEPAGIADRPLAAGGRWLPGESGHLAILPAALTEAAPDAENAILDFWESAYLAGAELAGWDIARLQCVEGVTDPVIAGRRS